MSNENVILIFDKIKPNSSINNDEMQMLLDLMSSDDPNLNLELCDVDKESIVYMHNKSIIEDIEVQSFLFRINNFTQLKLTLSGLLAIIRHLNRINATIIYAYYLHLKFPPNTIIDVSKIVTEAFPYGFYSDNQIDIIWNVFNTQNYKDNDSECTFKNMLDYYDNW